MPPGAAAAPAAAAGGGGSWPRRGAALLLGLTALGLGAFPLVRPEPGADSAAPAQAGGGAAALAALADELRLARVELRAQRLAAEDARRHLPRVPRLRRPVRPPPQPPPQTTGGKITVTAAAFYCNCPGIVPGGSAEQARRLAPVHAFARRLPFQQGDAPGFVDITQGAAGACDGAARCSFQLPSPAPARQCRNKAAVEGRCGGRPQRWQLFPAAPGDVMHIDCGAPPPAAAGPEVAGVRPVNYKFRRKSFNVWPISFSVPRQLWAGTVSWKDRGFAHTIPGNNATYAHGQAAGQLGQKEPDTDYFHDYRHAFYCVTRKKKGWDALRHYEIMAAGCVPYFVDLERMPVGVLPFFPRELVLEAMRLPGVRFNSSARGAFWHPQAFSVDLSVFPTGRYYELAVRLQQHGRRYLTSAAVARYLLEALRAEGGPAAPRRVLFVHHCYRDFLGDSLWTGFKELEADGELELVADVVPPKELSAGGPGGNWARLWQRGECVQGRKPSLMTSAATLRRRDYYGYSHAWGLHRALNRLPASTAVDPAGVPARIAAREFDVIIYASPQRTRAWIDVVTQHYPANAVALLSGSDTPEDIGTLWHFAANGTVFARELYDEPGAEQLERECMEAPGIAEAQGLDCCEVGEVGAQVIWEAEGGGGARWEHCGRENDECHCATVVRFGDPREGKWAYRDLGGRRQATRCHNQNTGGPFPDPAVGAVKVCQCRLG